MVHPRWFRLHLWFAGLAKGSNELAPLRVGRPARAMSLEEVMDINHGMLAEVPQNFKGVATDEGVTLRLGMTQDVITQNPAARSAKMKGVSDVPCDDRIVVATIDPDQVKPRP